MPDAVPARAAFDAPSPGPLRPADKSERVVLGLAIGVLLAAALVASLRAPSSVMTWAAPVVAIQLAAYWNRSAVFVVALLSLATSLPLAWIAAPAPGAQGAAFNALAGCAAILLTTWLTWLHGVEHVERVRTQHQLSVYARELERSNEDLQQFAYVASHDLQEPLRMVSGYCHLLATRYTGRLDQDADDFLQFAKEGADRMKQLVDDLLAYSRLGSLPSRLGDVRMEEVVAEAIRNLQLAIQETNATIDVGPLPVLRGDHARLVQLFQNLLSNALKFRGETPPAVRVEAVPDGEGWRFSVRDNGIGFDSRQAERIFLMFRRLHPRGDYPGTGIGLALCRRIVEQHGGRIWTESSPGAGSTFHFTLTPAIDMA